MRESSSYAQCLTVIALLLFFLYTIILVKVAAAVLCTHNKQF